MLSYSKIKYRESKRIGGKNYTGKKGLLVFTVYKPPFQSRNQDKNNLDNGYLGVTKV